MNVAGDRRRLVVAALAALLVAFAAGGFALGRSSRTTQAAANAAQRRASLRTYAIAYKAAYFTAKDEGFAKGVIEGEEKARVQATRAGLLQAAAVDERHTAELKRRAGHAR